MRIELNEHDEPLQHVLDLNAYHQGLLAEISGPTGSGMNPDQLAGLYYLLDIQSELVKAAMRKDSEAKKLKAA